MSQTNGAQLEQPPPSGDAVSAPVPGTTAGIPPTAQTFFAVVNSNGTLARGFQVASSQILDTGLYEVIFNFDVTGGAYVACLGSSASGREATGQITTAARIATPNGVFVTTSDSTGTLANHSFHLAVHS
jgi:hypothetical protein